MEKTAAPRRATVPASLPPIPVLAPPSTPLPVPPRETPPPVVPIRLTPWENAKQDVYAIWSRWQALRKKGEPAEAERAELERALLSALSRPLGDDLEDLARIQNVMGLVVATAADPGMAGFGETLWNLPGDAGKLAAIAFWSHVKACPVDRVLPYLLQATGSVGETNARRMAADALIGILSDLPEGRIERIQASAAVLNALPVMLPGRRGVALLWAAPYAGEQAVPALRTMLLDAETRELARLSVASLPKDLAAEFLPEVRRSMQDGCPYAALALGELGEKDAVPYLRKADFPSDPSLRMSAAYALAVLDDDSGRQELASWLERPEWMHGVSERKVLTGLARLQDERARPGLEAMAKSVDPERRKAGEEGLKLLGP